MASYTATVLWERGADDFLDCRYGRRHAIRFDGGLEIAGSSSPHVVPAPLSDPAAVDPEEAFIAALASCHMLWFLDIASRHGWRVDRYHDAASGVLARNAEGRYAMTQVTLQPQVSFPAAHRPSREQLVALHHEAHEKCYIANSVRSEVLCEPRFDDA